MKHTKLLLTLILAAVATIAAETPAAPALPLYPMISVQGGTFLMGSNEGSFRVSERVHEVRVCSFLLSETEVTQELYTAVMQENPSYFKGPALPVDSVSWLDTILFCNALSLRSGLPPAYTIEGETVTWNRDSMGYRLPTEAEWEYAARGGVKGAVGNRALEKASFAGDPQGDSPGNPREYCWYAPNGASSTHPVKSKLPNQLGLYDMSGNVWEWCWDLFGDYPAEPVDNYAGSSAGRSRIYRGGSYLNQINQLRTTFRIWEAPALRARTMGFRIALDIEDPGCPQAARGRKP
ncbi:MAG: formylglycine-generating enzyme family protein [Spirochaetaceae bacterium]|jgi:formylglycine-generating enzyme required for sulfatase activity|nr:formylglycine-generating enzyme family protein [Spirochaetaceae bacterium]